MAGIETVHASGKRTALPSATPTDCKFLFNECWFPMSGRGSTRQGGRGRREALALAQARRP